jgi:hypothetical protein
VHQQSNNKFASIPDPSSIREALRSNIFSLHFYFLTTMSKRAKSGDGETPVSWDEIAPKIQQMSKDQIIGCLATCWNSRSDMRLDIAATAEHAHAAEQERKRNTWISANDQTDILDFDWATKDDTMNFKIQIAAGDSTRIELQGYQFSMEVEIDEFKKMLETGEVDLQSDECGCEECGAPGSYLEMDLQQKGDTEHRLVTTSHIFCGCMSRYGEPEDNGGGEEIYYIHSSAET